MEGYNDIVLANGERHACSAVLTAGNSPSMYIDLPGMTLSDAARIFSNSDNTNTMSWAGRVYTGWTNMIMLTVQPYGVEVTLRRNA